MNPSPQLQDKLTERLAALVKRWHADKESRFANAKGQPDAMQKRTIEHGGMVLFNAYRAIETLLLEADEKSINDQLHALISTWSARAVRRLAEARIEPYLPGAKLVEHGARVTLNCAIALHLVVLSQNPGDQRACDLALEVFEQDALRTDAKTSISPWPEGPIPAGFECRSTPANHQCGANQDTRSFDFTEGAEQAMALMQLEPPPPGDDDERAQRVFNRVLPDSALSDFDWLYLLSTLLALRQAKPADAALPQVAPGAFEPPPIFPDIHEVDAAYNGVNISAIRSRAAPHAAPGCQESPPSLPNAAHADDVVHIRWLVRPPL